MNPVTLRGPQVRSSSFNAIPGEIYCLIFIYARSASLLDIYYANQRHIEITISHVCQLWRNISLNYPVLWNTIRYSVPKSETPSPTDLLAMYLDRSQGCLLEIWWNFRKRLRPALGVVHSAMLTSLADVATRWRRITLLLDHDDESLLLQCVQLCKLNPTHLEHFSICPQRGEGECRIPQEVALSKPRIFLAGAPKLTSVRLESSSWRPLLPPLANIVTIRLESPSKNPIPQDGIRLSTLLNLFSLKFLENVSLSGFTLTEDVPIANSKIFTSTLRDFRCGCLNLVALLPLLEAPHLHTLTLKNAHLPILVAQSLPSLQSLILLNTTVHWTSFATSPSTISMQIKHLTISENSASGTFSSHALTCMSKDIWPELVTLSCNIQQISHIDMYLQLAAMNNTHPFTLRINRRLLEMWFDRANDSMTTLKAICYVQAWDEVTPLIPHQWPYTEEFNIDHVVDKMDHDNFRVLSYH